MSFKLYHILKDYFNIITILGLMLNLWACGRQNSEVPIDDHDSDDAIAYPNGVGNKTVTLAASSQIAEENPHLLTAFKNAVATWNSAIGRSVLTMSTVTTPSTGNSFTSGCDGVSQRLFYPLCDNIFGVYYDLKMEPSPLSTGWLFNTGKTSNVIATTIWAASNQMIYLSDIRFNRDSYRYGDTGVDDNIIEDGTLKYIVDMESVFLHELGHLLGLGHAGNETDSIMFPTLKVGPDTTNSSAGSTAQTIKRALSTSDIHRIKTIYR